MIHIAIVDILIYIYLSIFSIMFLFIVNDILIHLFTQWFVIYLFRCMHRLFDFHLQFLLCKKSS